MSVLESPVRRFVDDVGDALAAMSKDVPGADRDQLHRDAALEAFNLACGFIAADGRLTDDELWELTGTFSALLDDNQLAGATPDKIRASGLVEAQHAFVRMCSPMFELLVAADGRDGTDHSRVYYDAALELAFSVAAIDVHTSQSELEAVEAFRAHLLTAINARPQVRSQTTGAASAPGPDAPPLVEDAPPRAIDELLAELDALVGMKEVKSEVHLVTNLLRVQQLRRERGLPVLDQSRHLVFTGNPGTGKTTVARLLAQIYRTLGVVARGHLVESDRSQLVAGYVGQTAIQVRKVFDEADGGVLLIDEAYALARGGERDFGREAIDTIVKLVEDRRDSIVVILAGYPEEMAELVDSNPGMQSRFPRTITFPDYSDEELVQIFDSLGKKGHYETDAAAREAVRAFFAARPRTRGFGNGRLARNLFEQAVARQATRLVELKEPTDVELCTLVATDIPEAAAVVSS